MWKIRDVVSLRKDKCRIQTRLQKLHYNYGHAVMHFIAGFKFLPPLLPLTGYNKDWNEAVTQVQ